MKFKNVIGLGVAGNFAGHLEQAGEAADFASVTTIEEIQPKAIFPFYVPAPQAGFLSVYPLSSKEIQLCLPQVKIFLDPGYAIAKRVQSLLEGIKVRSKKEVKNFIFCTRHFDQERQFEKVIRFWGFEQLTLLNVD